MKKALIVGPHDGYQIERLQPSRFIVDSILRWSSEDHLFLLSNQRIEIVGEHHSGNSGGQHRLQRMTSRVLDADDVVVRDRSEYGGRRHRRLVPSGLFRKLRI